MRQLISMSFRLFFGDDGGRPGRRSCGQALFIGRADRRVRRNRTALSLRHFRFDFLDRLIPVLMVPSFRSPFPLPELVGAASDAFFLSITALLAP